jgi:hypothetical protein
MCPKERTRTLVRPFAFRRQRDGEPLDPGFLSFRNIEHRMERGL